MCDDILNRNYYVLKGAENMSTWTIIGGGIQAVTIAIKLKSIGIKDHELTIIDPHQSLCEQFEDYTQRIQMPYLRSPCVHHIHPNPFHLNQFAKCHQYINASYGPYKRPNRALFIDHIHHLLHKFNLNKNHIVGFANKISFNQKQWHVQLSQHNWVTSDYLVIATGCNHVPYIPHNFKHTPDVYHIFDSRLNLHKQTSHVVGSGISAAHVTLKLLQHQPQSVIHLWTNKVIDVHDFDADPGWLGPKKMSNFSALTDSKTKLKIIQKERHKGSMPKELALRLKKHMKQGKLIMHINELKDIHHHHICTEQYCMFYDSVVLATGFEDTLMQQPIIKQLVKNFNAPVSDAGLPSISSHLEWLPNLFVTGGLADLELGPFARNIMGGREAAAKIATAALSKKRIEHKIYLTTNKHI